MITIYTGNSIPQNWDFDYKFPEACSKKELVLKGIEIFEKGKNEDVTILTSSAMFVELLATLDNFNEEKNNRYFLDKNIINHNALHQIYNALDLYKNINKILIGQKHFKQSYDKNRVKAILLKN